VGEGTKKAGMEQPTKIYTPSIAPGSLVVYQGKAFPNWQGNILVSALKLTHINRVELDKLGKAVAETRLLESLDERIRALLIGTDGYIYFSTDSGKVMRLVPR
jgi:glucose/arabinose dehydrogenase